MDEQLALTTADPRFDPKKAVTINGFLYVPLHMPGASPYTVETDAKHPLHEKVERYEI